MHLHGPFQELTEHQALAPGLWYELECGTICKLYSRADWINAYLDFRLICPKEKAITETGQNMAARIGKQLVELTCNSSLCLITISYAMDARAAEENEAN